MFTTEDYEDYRVGRTRVVFIRSIYSQVKGHRMVGTLCINVDTLSLCANMVTLQPISRPVEICADMPYS